MAHRIDRIGYWGTCLLALTLPFNPSNRQIGRVGTIHLTQLTVIIVLLAFLGSVTILLSRLHQKAYPARVGSRRFRLVAGLIVASAVMAIVSSAKAASLSEAPTWLLSVLAGGILSISIPIWIAPAPRLRVGTVGRFFVAGAVLAALIGFAEFTFGSAVEPLLVAFRPGPTLVGSYLRSSGPFSHANVAAMYFCLALPFAINELMVSLRKGKVSWTRSATWLAATDVLLLALLLTYSRGGLVACAVSLVVMGLAAGRKSGPVRVFGSRRHLSLVLNGAIVLCMFALCTSSIDAMRLSGQGAAGWYAVAFETHGLSHMSPVEMRSIAVTVKNNGLVPWRASRHGEYAVGYHWLYPSW